MIALGVSQLITTKRTEERAREKRAEVFERE